MAGYSGTPLPKKLGINEGFRVALVGAPKGMARTIGALPPGAALIEGARGKVDLTLWFVASRKELERGIARMAARGAQSGLWVCWPKKTSKLAADVSEADVRRCGLDAGLVDFKICAVDDDWSGLRFNLRSTGSSRSA